MVAFASERSERPVLPPLHSLGLPNPRVPNPHEYIYDNTTCPRLHIPQLQWQRPSPSSSTTSDSSDRPSTPDVSPSPSAPPTPVLAVSPLPARTPADPNAPPVRFRLEPCPLADAQAIVLVPPPTAPFIPSSAMPTPPQKQQALLFLGTHLEYFRKPDRQLVKGARVHPYRVVPSQRKDGPEQGQEQEHPL